MAKTSKTTTAKKAGTTKESVKKTSISSTTKAVKKATEKEKKTVTKKTATKKTAAKATPAGTTKKATLKTTAGKTTAAAKTKTPAGTVKKKTAITTATPKAPAKSMPVKKTPEKKISKNPALDIIVDAMYDKKAQQVVSLDFATIDAAICDYFVICNADSTTQVNAIADSVEEQLYKKMKQWPIRCQGRENSFWIIMDYGDVIVHIFQTEYRKFYRLEELWADAKTTWHEEQ